MIKYGKHIDAFEGSIVEAPKLSRKESIIDCVLSQEEIDNYDNIIKEELLSIDKIVNQTDPLNSTFITNVETIKKITKDECTKLYSANSELAKKTVYNITLANAPGESVPEFMLNYHKEMIKSCEDFRKNCILNLRLCSEKLISISEKIPCIFFKSI